MNHPLTTAEVLLLQKQFGLNEIISSQRKTTLSIVLSQFSSIFIAILAIAALLSFALGDIPDGICIIAIIIINSALGFFQEYKAEKAIEILTKQSIFLTRVLRDEKEQEIDNRYLVPGDIIKLEAGNKIPADALLLESTNVEVDEAILTGESLPVYKHSADATTHSLFMGTVMLKGRCTAVVKTIGMQTSFGKLTATLSSLDTTPTHLEQRIIGLGKKLTFVGIVLSSVVFCLSLYYHEPLITALLISISLIVAVVPEGLPAIITIVLATGAARLTKKNVIIRKMSAVETLGEITIIATDKTGTLTQNKMAVKKIWINAKTYEAPTTSLNQKDVLFEKFFQTSILCNNAQLLAKDNNTPEVIGDKTEGALLLFAASNNISIPDIKQQWEFIDEFSFDEQHKTMSVLYKHDKDTYTLSKGAPESLLARCSSLLSENGKQILLSETKKEEIQKAYQAYAAEGLRLIALAYKPIQALEKKYLREKVESDLIFIGFVGIADPLRIEAKSTIQKAREAGIKTIMITGDNEITAATIAQEIGLIKKGDAVITGLQLDQLSDDEFFPLLPEIDVYARCTSEHKLRIVKAYQKQGQTVAVTGDGINDALSLKQANVGIAMGKTGTDVTRETADIVITDDNFTSIVAGIEEGRIIFTNIIKSVHYLVAGNMSELLTIVIAVALGLPSPFLPVHILWINLVTDSLPALALALDTKSSTVMKHPPIDSSRELITNKQFIKLGSYSLIITLCTLGVYWALLQTSTLFFARTMAFTLLIVLQMGLALFLRGKRTWHENLLLYIAIALALCAQVAILTIPFLQTIFHISLHF